MRKWGNMEELVADYEKSLAAVESRLSFLTQQEGAAVFGQRENLGRRIFLLRQEQLDLKQAIRQMKEYL